jgi:hypothetical protein
MSLPIDLFSYPNEFFRARDRAEPATFATLSINFDLGHHPTNRNTGIMEKWNGRLKESSFSLFSFCHPLFQYSNIPLFHVLQIAFTSLKY